MQTTITIGRLHQFAAVLLDLKRLCVFIIPRLKQRLLVMPISRVYLVCTVTTESPKTKQKEPYSQVHIPLVWVLLFYCRALYWRSVTLLPGL